MSTQRFAVEFDRRTVGIAVRVPGGFMFYASDDRFNEMDGSLFPRARAIERQLKRVARHRTHRKQALQFGAFGRLTLAAPNASFTHQMGIMR